MEELIHIPYGACIAGADGEIKNKLLFTGNDIHNSFENFYNLFADTLNEEVSYLYFLTIDAKSLPFIRLNTIYDIFTNQNKNKPDNSYYAQYGIYAYSISKSSTIHSYRITHLTNNPFKVFAVLGDLCKNAVAPSHITEVLESINEKTPA